MVALSVLIIGLSAAAGLVFSNVQTQEISTDRIIASNLAREGVEMARSIRDSNWLAGLAFNTGLSSGTDYSAAPEWNAGGTFTGFNFTPTAMANTSFVELSNAGASNGALYVQGAAAGTNTLYKRFMTLYPICQLGSVLTADGQTCPGSEATVGVRVTSAVQWTKKNVTRQSVIVDDIYDWR